MTVWTDDFRAVVDRARAKLAADRGQTLSGPTHWDLPQSVKEAIWDDLDSGAYEEAARAATADDPEMTQR